MAADFVSMQLHGLEGTLEALKALPPELVSRRGGVVRRALRMGAAVIHKQAKANFRAAVALAGKSGVTQSTGFTEKNIIIRRHQMTGGEKGEWFTISVAPKAHPLARIYRSKSKKGKGKPIRANDIAFFMETGTSKQAATPWLRPAFTTRAAEAIRVVEAEILNGIEMATKKLNRGGK